MKVFSKMNLLVGITTLLIGLGASAAIWGLPSFLRGRATVKGQVNNYLLNEQGAVDGLLLSTGDQLHFSPATGAVVAAQIKIGDEVTGVGYAGQRSKYGREVRIEQLTANGRTFIESSAGPPRPKDHHGPPAHRGDDSLVPPAASIEHPPSAPPLAGPQTPLAAMKVTGAIQVHLVNRRGDVDGLILTGGEQLHLDPQIGELVVSAEQTGTQVSVEGMGLRSERGVVIHAETMTIGNQTMTLGR